MVIRQIFRKPVLFLLIFILAGIVVSDALYKSELKYKMKVANLERKIHKIEDRGQELVNLIAEKDEINRAYIDLLKKASEEKGIVVARYTNNKLDIWSENSFELIPEYSETLSESPFIYIQNRWFVLNKAIHDDAKYIWLIDVYRNYTIENDYIHSGFSEKLNLPEQADISLDPTAGYIVNNSSGEYLFSVIFDRSTEFNTWYLIIPLLFWCALLFLIAHLLKSFLDYFKKVSSACYCVLIAICASLAIYLLFLLSGRPLLITHLDLFQPFRFTLGKFIPSPGHLMFLSILFVYISYAFKRWWPCGAGNRDGKDQRIALGIFLLVAAIIFYVYVILLSSLVTSSNISFEFYRILEIDYFSVVSFVAVALIPVGLHAFLNTVFLAYGKMSVRDLQMSISPAIIFLVLMYVLRLQNPLFELIAFILLVTILWAFRFRKSVMVVVSICVSLVIGVFTAWFISKEFQKSEKEKLEVFAVNQSANNDLMAEALLIEMWDKLQSDTILPDRMTLDYFIEGDINKILNYLDTEYFTAYWEQYDIHYTVCNYDSPLQIDGEENDVNCFAFFDDMIAEMGVPVIDSALYFLDNHSGRPYYLAKLLYNNDEQGVAGLFIEFVNRIEYAQPGYPELLQNKKYFRQIQLKEYSFAKYIGDSLVMQTGSFPFDLSLEHRADSVGVFKSFTENDFNCIVYAHNDEVSVVVARPRFKFQNVLINFTYIFIIFFLLFTIASWIIAPPSGWSFSGFDFRQKLQYSFILVLLGSIIGIGSVVVSLTISQFRAKHFDNISEKLRSVSIELDHKLSDEEVLTFDWHQDAYENLDVLLIKFSNVFGTDINLFSTDGLLLATSRRELFERNIVGRRMDYKAYSELLYFGSSQYIFEDKAGDLTFLSAYAPFSNYRGEVLAYLNLPYFAVQSRLSEEISNLIVTIINFSLILIVISIGITIFIAVQITSPLRMLREGMASVSLEGETLRLEYGGQDEIAKIVEQYNNMLDQLRESALKLARSEREDAWRDMAKQIAHEIKNPLTPMKLNVQQLQKSWKDDPDTFDKRIARFSDNMIENIDNLSSIATEFSNFARMPQAKLQEINLVSKISSAAELYKNIRNVDLKLRCSGLTEVIILGDREHINMMLTNVIRNAVQSIPSNRKGLVEIGLKIVDDRVVISVSDNGVGIPKELGEKLFVPNFTTKSSGMGIGLALVKRIVETAKGEIYYKSELDKGSTFFINFPVISSVGN